MENLERQESGEQDSVLQLGIVSSYCSRGGIKVCSRPLWGLISAGYQGIIGGRAAKRQFTPRTEPSRGCSRTGCGRGPVKCDERPPLAPSSPSALLSGALASLLRDAHSSALSVLVGETRAQRAKRCEEGGRVRCEGRLEHNRWESYVTWQRCVRAKSMPPALTAM